MIIAALIVVFSAVALGGCADKGEENAPPAEDNRLLKAVGDDFVDENGNKVFIKAVNAGGLFVQEEWMCATDCVDHLTLLETLETRFGKTRLANSWIYTNPRFGAKAISTTSRRTDSIV